MCPPLGRLWSLVSFGCARFAPNMRTETFGLWDRVGRVRQPCVRAAHEHDRSEQPCAPSETTTRPRHTQDARARGGDRTHSLHAHSLSLRDLRNTHLLANHIPLFLSLSLSVSLIPFDPAGPTERTNGTHRRSMGRQRRQLSGCFRHIHPIPPTPPFPLPPPCFLLAPCSSAGTTCVAFCWRA